MDRVVFRWPALKARQLIIAQSMAGGEPSEEMTAPVAED
jgi:hypothetical protein